MKNQVHLPVFNVIYPNEALVKKYLNDLTLWQNARFSRYETEWMNFFITEMFLGFRLDSVFGAYVPAEVRFRFLR
jgi:hypothetical protein